MVTPVTLDYRPHHSYLGIAFHNFRHYPSRSTPINHIIILISTARHTECRCYVEYTPRILPSYTPRYHYGIPTIWYITPSQGVRSTRTPFTYAPSPLWSTCHMVHPQLYGVHSTCTPSIHTVSPLWHTSHMVHHYITWSTLLVYSLHTHYDTSPLWHPRHMVHHSTT